jgi:hypothetical protein
MPGSAGWDLLTNHTHVLTCVADDPGIRLRDIAAAVGITERAAHKILSDLVEEGYVLREREGRRNRYQVVPELPLRHPLVQGREVGDLLKVLIGAPGDRVRASGNECLENECLGPGPQWLIRGRWSQLAPLLATCERVTNRSHASLPAWISSPMLAPPPPHVACQPNRRRPQPGHRPWEILACDPSAGLRTRGLEDFGDFSESGQVEFPRRCHRV